MNLADALLTAIAPPRCLACAGSTQGGPLCGPCRRALAAWRPLSGPGPPGLDAVWSSAPHEGVARRLVVALKFRRLLPVATLLAGRIATAPPQVLSGTLVPVPAAGRRRAARGFDPAAEIAVALAAASGLPLTACLRRRGGGRQVGRRRAERLGAPPSIRVAGPVSAGVVLVDDVLTTGATLSACAAALRGAGAIRVVAVTATRRL